MGAYQAAHRSRPQWRSKYRASRGPSRSPQISRLYHDTHCNPHHTSSTCPLLDAASDAQPTRPPQAIARQEWLRKQMPKMSTASSHPTPDKKRPSQGPIGNSPDLNRARTDRPCSRFHPLPWFRLAASCEARMVRLRIVHLTAKTVLGPRSRVPMP